MGQDGGLVSALLIWAFEHDVIDAALVSGLEGDGSTWKAVPRVARTKEDVLATAGSRYTYSANPLAYAEAIEGGAERIALVGMGCQASAPPVMQARKAGKVARRFALSIGLLCSKTFDDAIFPELFEAKYGLARADIVKMNIKGVFQVWMKDGSYHEVPLKEAHAWTREGCTSCPDFAAEHADISTGGIGAFGDWTLTLLRTEKGEELFNDMEAAGVIETRPIEDDPGAVTLLNKLSRVSRKRWPATAVPMPGRLPAPASDRLTCPDERPRDDAFAALLGIEVERRGPATPWPASPPTSGTPTRTAPCTAPSSTPWPAPRWPRRPTTPRTPGIISSVLVEYLATRRARRRAVRRGGAERSRPAARTSSPAPCAGAPRATCWPGCGPAAPAGPPGRVRTRRRRHRGCGGSRLVDGRRSLQRTMTRPKRASTEPRTASCRRWPNLWEPGH